MMVEFDTDNLMTSTLTKVDLEVAEREKYKNLHVTNCSDGEELYRVRQNLPT